MASTQSEHTSQVIQLQRGWINALQNKQFVALSYTWKPSEFENPSHGLYEIQSRDQSDYFPSTTRDCVFQRVLRYMDVCNVPYLWIDKHCIRQRGCQSVCKHKSCNTKRKAIHAMDLVYSKSKYPVALLGRPIESEGEIRLLAKVLRGELVRNDRIRLLNKETDTEVMQALLLLHSITSDYWWTRAWTFQENYRASTKMILLIQHPPELEQIKSEFHDEFGDVTGELSIRSATFSKETTRFCLAVKAASLHGDIVERVLSKAGKYSLLLSASDSMTTAIVADLQTRFSTDKSDLLGIIANCCQYRKRLKPGLLRDGNENLHIFALRILNGEILANGRMHQCLSEHTLESLFFRDFRPPRSRPSLTYNKSCRFYTVKLTQMGIVTPGHLWKLDRLIQTKDYSYHLGRSRRKSHAQRCLSWLTIELKKLGAEPLARKIEQCIQHYDSKRPPNLSGRPSFSRRFVRTMVNEIVASIAGGKPLATGHIYSPVVKDSTPTALFVYGTHRQNRLLGTSQFVFTASLPKRPDYMRQSHNDLDRHVSLEVDYIGRANNLPMLYVKQWMTGLCFFTGCSTEEVVFPWPDSLKEVVV